MKILFSCEDFSEKSFASLINRARARRRARAREAIKPYLFSLWMVGITVVKSVPSATSGTRKAELRTLETRKSLEVRCIHIGHRPPVEAIAIPMDDIIPVSGK